MYFLIFFFFFFYIEKHIIHDIKNSFKYTFSSYIINFRFMYIIYKYIYRIFFFFFLEKIKNKILYIICIFIN